MPFGDRTGPRGMGPMTGRGGGYCAGFNRPGFINWLPGRRWFGFGWRRDYEYPYAYRAQVPYQGYSYPYHSRGYPAQNYPYVYR